MNDQDDNIYAEIADNMEQLEFHMTKKWSNLRPFIIQECKGNALLKVGLQPYQKLKEISKTGGMKAYCYTAFNNLNNSAYRKLENRITTNHNEDIEIPEKETARLRYSIEEIIDLLMYISRKNYPYDFCERIVLFFLTKKEYSDRALEEIIGSKHLKTIKSRTKSAMRYRVLPEVQMADTEEDPFIRAFCLYCVEQGDPLFEFIRGLKLLFLRHFELWQIENDLGLKQKGIKKEQERLIQRIIDFKKNHI